MQHHQVYTVLIVHDALLLTVSVLSKPLRCANTKLVPVVKTSTVGLKLLQTQAHTQQHTQHTPLTDGKHNRPSAEIAWQNCQAM